MEINGKFVPSVKEGIDIEQLDDGCILYNTQNDDVHSLNSTAAFIWSCCDGKHSVERIVTIIEENFKPKRETVLQDIIKIIKGFSKKGLLVEN